jgi:hypothetical protein
MNAGIFVLMLALSLPATAEDKQPTAKEQYKALLKQYQEASGGGAATTRSG